MVQKGSFLSTKQALMKIFIIQNKLKERKKQTKTGRKKRKERKKEQNKKSVGV